MLDLAPRYKLIPARDKVVLADPVTQIGGIMAGSSSVKQGDGDESWNVTEKGMHVGAADFVDAPFSVSMTGHFHTVDLDMVTADDVEAVLQFGGGAVDATSGAGTKAGRIKIKDKAGNTRYLYFYSD
jgi:hypothetical protein